MKFRGGLLALLVLGVATILMVFFVLPRLGGDTETKPEAAAPAKVPAATPEAKPAQIATPAVDPAAATAAASAKMGRLMQEASGALKNIEGLFAEGKIPGAETLAAAKTTAETALAVLAATDLPEGIEQGAADAISKARAGASRALGLLKALPADPQAAATAINGLAAALTGNEPSTTAAANPPAAPVEANPEAAARTPAAPATTDTAAVEVTLPKFDVLRVEPDGSTVIAGSAAPGTRIEIVDGAKVLSSTEVGPTGDFAAVLDNPLSPGDHALALRAVDPKGAAVTSEEVATISVPEKAQGQLLAMITKPGEASRVITMPENVNTADKQQRVASTTEQPAAPVATPELPQASALLSTSAPTIATETPAAAPATAAPAAPAATTPAEIQVTAVEIEGDRIFIAGTAPPASRVRAYADDVLVGEVSTDASSHFVVEGNINLAVGGHTIRVDLLDAAGQVAVRASVPFDRPAGEQVAVVAAVDGAASKPASLVPQDQSAFDGQRDALSRAFGILSGLYAEGKKPTLEALAAARSATEIALKSLGEFRPVGDAAQGVADQVRATAAGAGKALAALEALPLDVDAIGNALPQIKAIIDAVLQGGPTAAASVTASAAPAAATPVPAAPASTAAGAAAPKTIEQAPLTASRDSVIIRQGDTLWQISRRVYGQGVRYTTIYLANEGQITNPDQIEPGQIFSVPTEALPNAEELHRRRLRGEAID